MAKAKQTVITEQTVPIEADSQPGVVAYRVGRLELSTEAGFKRLEIKLEELKQGFVTTQQMKDAIDKSQEVHKELERRIFRLERWNDWLTRLFVGSVILAIIAIALKTNIGG